MKRISKFLLSGLLVFGLCACASENESSSESKPQTKETKKMNISFESTTLVDNDYATFTVNSIEKDGTMKVTLENKSDMTLMFSIEDASINGMMEDPFWADEVTSGMKANETISFPSTLKDDGIDLVSNITFTIRISNSEDWSLDPYVVEEFTLYPYGQENEETLIRKGKESDIVFVDNDQVTILIDSVDENGFYGYTLRFYLENKTDQNLMYSIENASVNGYMADPFWAKNVPAHKKAYSEVFWSSDLLEENNIESISTIDMPFTVSNYGDWMASPILEQVFTYSVE
ncbi:hypothetical protein [Floccifex sp.]|uniref:hypothetical protein n=1 Tax=Floccifex sp. TaxID=2815810 RepID=UPI003EFD1337